MINMIKNKTIIFGFFLIITTTAVFSQNNDRVFYLFGRISETVKINVFAVQSHESFQGTMLIQGINRMLTVNGQAYKTKIVFSAIDENGDVYGEFDAQWNGTQLSGKILKSDTFEEKSFYLDKGLFPGNWDWTVYSGSAQKKLSNKDEAGPQAELAMFFVYPVKGPDPKVLASIQSKLDKIYFGQFAGKKNVLDRMKAYEDFYFKDYLSLIEEKDDMVSDYYFNYTATTFTRIIWANNEYVCISIDDYSYTGGAHGQPKIDYFIFSLKSGQTISLAELLTDKLLDKLPSLIKVKILSQLSADSGDKLTDWGFFEDEVAVPGTFYIDAFGIGFVYNVYEIAPYAAGIIEVYFTYEELENGVKFQIQ